MICTTTTTEWLAAMPTNNNNGRHLHTQWLLLTCIFLIGIFAIEVDIAINLFSLLRTQRQQEQQKRRKQECVWAMVLLIPILYVYACSKST